MLQIKSEPVKKAPLIGAFLFAGLFSNASFVVGSECNTRQYDEAATLDKVYDGDTIRLTDGRKVRLIAVNTPEMARKEQPAQALAKEATQSLEQMFQRHRRVYLKYGADRKDRYKRVLAHVFTAQGKNVAAELIRQGLGYAILVPPNDWQHECYFKLEQQAQKNNKGIWLHSDYRVRQTADLTREMTGFQLVEGRISKIGHGKKWLWLDMAPLFSVKVERRNLKYFTNQPIESLTGKSIRLRGWVAYYNGKLRMSLRHPAMMEILD